MTSDRRQPGFDRVAAFGPLVAATREAARGHRRSPEVAAFLVEVEAEALTLERELIARTYRPRTYRTFAIRDPKPRVISAAAFRDRVVHQALCAEIVPALERDASAASFACRRGRGVLSALRRAQALARRHPYVLKLDVLHFFETIPHAPLRSMLRRRVRDEGLRWLLDVFLDAGAPGSLPGRGLPIGNLTSQHFANFALAPVDRLLERGLRVPGYCRYMDDLLIFGGSRRALWNAKEAIEHLLETRLGLALRPNVTRLAPTSEGVSYLGFAVYPGTVRFDPRRLRRWRRRMATAWAALDRSGGLDEDALRTAESLTGWAMHGATMELRRSFVARRLAASGRGGTRARTG